MIGNFLFSSNYYTDVECVNHLHGNIEIIIIHEGTLKIKLNHLEFDVEAGSAIIASSFKMHQFISQKTNRSQVIIFSGELLPYFAKHLDFNKIVSPIFKPSAESLALIKKILPDGCSNPDYIHLQAVLSCLACDICEQCEFVPRKNYDSEPLSIAIDYIHTHFSEDISLESVAKEVGIHPVTLSKNFAANVNTNFNTYLNLLRCSNAANLLQCKSNTISEVAFLSGFGSIRSFNRSFIKVFHVTPTQYRKNPFV